MIGCSWIVSCLLWSPVRQYRHMLVGSLSRKRMDTIESEERQQTENEQETLGKAEKRTPKAEKRLFSGCIIANREDGVSINGWEWRNGKRKREEWEEKTERELWMWGKKDSLDLLSYETQIRTSQHTQWRTAHWLPGCDWLMAWES